MASSPSSTDHERSEDGALNTSDSICLIVNPRAGAGRAGREL